MFGFLEWRKPFSRSLDSQLSPNRVFSVHGPAPYVMHNRLAVFVYLRLSGFSAPALRISDDGSHWTLNQYATMACGTKEQISNLVAKLDELLESEKETAKVLRGRVASLQESFEKVMADLDYAIAARRLRKQCDLVPFF